MIRLVMTLGLLVGATVARSFIDLTHTFDENAPKYPLAEFGVDPNMPLYELKTLTEEWHPNGQWLALKYVEFYEHQGTHMDAPYNFGAGRQTMEQIPVQKLVGPGVNINVRKKVLKNSNYAVTVEDIEEYETKYGKIPPNAIVIMNSGWAEKYDNAKLVFGTEDLLDKTTFNFPGWSIEACTFLLTKRQISVLGVDTPSVDPANLSEFKCHRYLQPNNVPLLEYVANLDAMPAAGSTVFLGAMKHRGGTGGPTRIIALVDDDDDKGTSAAGTARFRLVFPLALFMILRGLK